MLPLDIKKQNDNKNPLAISQRYMVLSVLVLFSSRWSSSINYLDLLIYMIFLLEIWCLIFRGSLFSDFFGIYEENVENSVIHTDCMALLLKTTRDRLIYY